MLTLLFDTMTFLLISAWIGTLVGLTVIFLIKVAKLVVYEINQ